MLIDIDINKLNFGKDDAEAENKDGFLEKVFLRPSIYNKTKNLQNELVIGRKGAGKSALFWMLRKDFDKERLGTIDRLPYTFSSYKIELINEKIVDKGRTYYFL